MPWKKKDCFWFFKLHLPFSGQDRQSKGKEESSLTRKENLNEEYRQAFRTKSYMEICTTIQTHIETRTSLDQQESYIHLSEGLLQPQNEALNSLTGVSKTHKIILLSYFEISLEACRICETLLQNVHQVRKYHSKIDAVIASSSTQGTNGCGQDVYRNYLKLFSRPTNHFSSAMTSEKFRELHSSHESLLGKLTSQCKKTRRRSLLIKSMKRAMAGLLVVGCGALAIAFLILTIHTVAAVPCLVMCSLISFTMTKKKLRKDYRRSRQTTTTTVMEGMIAQLDIAARGVYIMINDFDTVSRLVRRLEDEMEHRRFVADICLRKGKKHREMLREVVREFQANEGCFQEQLEELERQIYLCFLDINRSRRLLVRELMGR